MDSKAAGSLQREPPKYASKKAIVAGFLVAIALIFVGAFFFDLYVFVKDHGTTPEDELTLAEGVPVGTESVGKNGSTLYFSVAGQRTLYYSRDAKYTEVVAAVNLRVPIRIWVSTKRETVFVRNDWVPLYKLEVGDRQVLTYNDVAAKKATDRWAPLILACVFLIPGVIVLCGCIGEILRQAKRSGESSDQPSLSRNAPRPAKKANMVLWGTIFISVLTYATAIYEICFDVRMREKLAVAFGTDIFGMPVTLVLVLVQTLLFLPMPWVFWHFLRIIDAMLEEGRTRVGIVSIVMFGLRRPDLRRSLIVSVLGFAYLGVFCLGWLSFATSPVK